MFPPSTRRMVKNTIRKIVRSRQAFSGNNPASLCATGARRAAIVARARTATFSAKFLFRYTYIPSCSNPPIAGGGGIRGPVPAIASTGRHTCHGYGRDTGRTYSAADVLKATQGHLVCRWCGGGPEQPPLIIPFSRAKRNASLALCNATGSSLTRPCRCDTIRDATKSVPQEWVLTYETVSVTFP